VSITLVGTDSGQESNNQVDINLTLPAHQADDFGIIFFRCDEAASSPVLALTAGWTEHVQENITSGRDSVESIWYRKFTSSSETDPVCSISGANEEHSALLYVLRGVDPTLAFDVTMTKNNGVNDSTPVNPAITPVNDNGALLLFHGQTHAEISAQGLPTTPASLVAGPNEIGSNRNAFSCYLLDYGTAATITPTAWTHTNSANTGEWRVYTIALRAATAADITIEVPSGSLGFTGQAPTAEIEHIRQVPVASISMTGVAPTISIVAGDLIRAPPVGALSIAGAAPSAEIEHNAQVPVGSLSFTGAAPTAVEATNADLTASPPRGTVEMDGYAPTLVYSWTVKPETGAIGFTGRTVVRPLGLSFQGQIPTTVVTGGGLQPGTGALSFQGQVPTINKWIPNPSGSLSFSSDAPNAFLTGGPGRPQPLAGALSFQGTDAEFRNSGDMRLTFVGQVPLARLWPHVSVGSLSIQGQIPAIINTSPTAMIVSPDVGILGFSGQVPYLQQHVALPVGSLSFTGYAPSAVLVDPAHTAGMDQGNIAFIGYAPTPVMPGQILPGTVSLAFSGQVPTISNRAKWIPIADARVVIWSDVSASANIWIEVTDAAGSWTDIKDAE